MDCIEILSFPGPVPPIDNNTLKKSRIVARDYRNRRIGDFLKELKLTEGRSTGIPKIRKAMKLNGSPPPELETDADRNYFLTTLPIHELSDVITQPGSDISQVTPQVTGEVAGEVASEVTDEVIKLLKTLAKSPMSRINAQALLKLKGQANFRDRYITPAINLNMIEMTIPDKPNSRLQKYRLTKKGQEYIRQYIISDHEKISGI